MMRRGFLSAIFISTVLTVSPTFAGTVQHLRGDLLTTEVFSYTDCSTVDLYVQGLSGKDQQPPGNGTPISQVYVGYYAENWCTGEWEDFYGYSDSALIEVDSKLESGSLQAVVEVFDYVTGLSRDITIDLEFTADGPAIRESQNYSRSYPGFRMRDRFQGTFRPALVTGAVWDGTENLVPPVPSGYYAELGTVRTAYIEVN